jgi:hypothetical protein
MMRPRHRRERRFPFRGKIHVARRRKHPQMRDPGNQAQHGIARPLGPPNRRARTLPRLEQVPGGEPHARFGGERGHRQQRIGSSLEVVHAFEKLRRFARAVLPHQAASERGIRPSSG